VDFVATIVPCVLLALLLGAILQRFDIDPLDGEIVSWWIVGLVLGPIAGLHQALRELRRRREQERRPARPESSPFDSNAK
jgi:predicted Kef-type K+ transport protein